MKKIKTIIAILMVIFIGMGCVTNQKVTTKKQKPTENTAQPETSCLVDFSGGYQTITTNINYTNADLPGIDFKNSQVVDFSSKLFLDNYKVKNREVHIISPELDSLKELPTYSIWRVENDSIDVKRDAKGIKDVKAVCFLSGKNIKYIFWFSRGPDGLFYINEKNPGWIVYKGNTYTDVIGRNSGPLKYCVINETGH